jgi:AraC-like DNA-binding protein/CheY-like chemotaxis protein
MGTVVIVRRHVGSAGKEGYVAALRAAGYGVVHVDPGTDPVATIERARPVAAIYQFDYPALAGLADLKHTKQKLPSIPLLMVTEAHSEAMAIWAFRAKIWDFLVQPVDQSYLLSILSALRQIRAQQPGALPRSSFSAPNAIPAEARVRVAAAVGSGKVTALVAAFVARNLHRKIGQKEVADLCGLSPFQFSRVFKREHGTTFQEYLMQERIRAAMEMFRNPAASVTDVCFSVGFSDLSYFARMFHRSTGLSPSRYRSVMTGRQVGSGPRSVGVVAKVLNELNTEPDER